MHKSRLSTVVIDCQTQQLCDAARFWAAALGWQAHELPDPDNGNYRELCGPPEGVKILVQSMKSSEPSSADGPTFLRRASTRPDFESQANVWDDDR